MNRKSVAIAALMLFTAAVSVFAQGGTDASAAVGIAKYIAAALAVGFACIAGGMAVGKIGAAAMGAMSENAELPRSAAHHYSVIL